MSAAQHLSFLLARYLSLEIADVTLFPSLLKRKAHSHQKFGGGGRKVFRLALPLAAIATAWLMGCQREPSAPSKPREPNPAGMKPFLVKTNAGIDHEFYRAVSLDDFLKLLPTGSIDSVDLNIGNGPQVFALVKVPDQPDRDLAKVRFETTFKTQDGQVIDKQWTAAKDRKSGKAAAVFCLPPSVVDGVTKVVPSSD